MDRGQFSLCSILAIIETDATGNGEPITFLFDAGGRLQETNLPNDISARYQYETSNKLTQLTNRTSQHNYGYDNVGRRSSHTESIANTTTNCE